MIKVGVLTPHAAAGPETEFSYMAAEQVQSTVSRIFSTEAAEDAAPPTSPSGLRALTEPAALDAAVAGFEPGSVDVLAYASTTSAYVIGHEAERSLVNALCERWSIPACSTSLAAVVALRQCHAQRLALVHPPWFGDELNDLGAAYFQSQGFTVVEAVLAAVPNDPSCLEPEMVVDWVSEHLSADAEAVFLGGNGFLAARAVHELESLLGCLVIESNQVLLWSIMGAMGSPTQVKGFGTLMQ